MSYFDYFIKNFNNEIPENTEAIQGTCLSMCPEEEVTMREKSRMVHFLEVIDGEKKHVKCYSRSAADSVVAVPRLLRPYETLRDTVLHLLLEVTKRDDVSPPVMYDFLNDRLRAVRQDMTIQRLSKIQCVLLLEPMIRFHVYYSYKLCEYPIKDFDPVLNKKYLLECMKWFLNCFDSIDKLSAMDNKVYNDYKPIIECDRELMESLYILCNLNDVHPMIRYWSLSKELKSDTTIKLAYEIAAANLKGNYIQVCKQLENLCPLAYCALNVHLPILQRQALQVMSSAYSSKQLTVPLRVLRRWLRFNSDAEAGGVCRHYGLVTDGGAVRFSKGNFLAGAALHPPRKLLLQDEKIDLSIENVLTYVTKL